MKPKTGEPVGAKLFLLACSPRAGGNCDQAAALFRESWNAALTNPLSPAASSAGEPKSDDLAAVDTGIVCRSLRDFRVAPCVGCGCCTRAAERAGSEGLCPWPAKNGQECLQGKLLGCPLSAADDSGPLLSALAGAGALAIIAPIYFYHLPAQLKALIDRTQPFWALQQAGLSGCFAAARLCHVILIGARPKGDKLFEGSLLSLRYALGPLGLRLAEPLLLYGLDQPSDLSVHEEYRRRIQIYAAQAAALFQADAKAREPEKE